MKSFQIIHNIPSPYRLHIFNEMWKQLEGKGIEFHVHFMSDMRRGHDKRPLSWRNPKIAFPHTYWRDYGVSHYHFNPGMLAHLLKVRPDWLLIGCTFDTFTGFIASQLFKTAVKCAWSEGNTKTPGILSGWKGWIKRKAFSGCQYVAVPGHDAVKYIALHQERTKAKMPEPIFLPNLIDEARFRPRSEWPDSDILSVRKDLGVSVDERLAITPARLDPVKGLVEYLSLLTPELLSGWRIAILGQGDLKDKLLSIAKERGIEDRVLIKDYVPYAEMPKFYSAADLFLLPSKEDPNPLSVVEALHSGLPVAVSEMTGNVDEAVSDRCNGWVLPVRENARYSRVLAEVFSAPVEKLREMGMSSKMKNAMFWDTQSAISSFLRGLGI